jgi:hypothetical protein
METVDIHELARCAVGLCVVEGECAIEAQDAGDGFSEFADGDVFAGADVDEGVERSL